MNKKADDGHLYLMPVPDAVPEFYHPMQVANGLVLEAVRIGRHLMHGTPAQDFCSPEHEKKYKWENNNKN